MKRSNKNNPPMSMSHFGDSNFDSVPDELKKLPRWVNWQMVERNGKSTKMPKSPTNGQPASCNDPSTWGTYDQAVERFNQGGIDGIGFQLGAGYVGIDLDQCRNQATGAIKPRDEKIIRDLNSYTELSPSGTGVHIIVKGALPPGGRKRGHIEMYDTSRYFTLTGLHLEGTPGTIQERPNVLKALHRNVFSKAKPKSKLAPGPAGASRCETDEELIERARRAENGAKFTRLWGGDYTGYSSQSEADLALCTILAFWAAQDADRIDRLFRQSGLYRDKWDERHGADGRTYGQITIDKVIRGAAGHHNLRPGRQNSNPDLGLIKGLADQILLSERFAQDPGGRLYRFHAGVYKPDGGAHLRRLVKKYLEEWSLTIKWSSARSEEVIEFIRVDAPILWARPPLNVVNLANGLLNLETGRLWPHSADHLSPVQLPVAFDPEATCPLWDRFVEDVFPTDAQDLPWQLVAWLMRPDVSVQKAVLLLGEGANGKSTFLTALGNFLGSSNFSAVSLHKLESDRFSVARLIGKLANICPDLPSSHLAGTSIFKAITGGDAVLAEYKYRDSFEFVPFTRLVFSANHPPCSNDSSNAFFRRWLVVPFTRTFEGGEEIPRTEMDARLSNPSELSGVLNRALQALRQIEETRGLLESMSMAAALDDLRTVTDPVAVWLDSHIIEGTDLYVPKRELLTAYNASASKAGRPSVTETGFGRALHRLRPNLTDAQRTVAGKEGVWVWLGLGLRSPED